MSTLFDQMMQRGHERVAFHHDPATGLKAIVAIHSTALGNALGGTRRWYYENEEAAIYDVLRLSEGMTYKAAAADLPMGGAKSVIMLGEPNQPGREAEARAMGRFVETFKGTYIAAEDVGVNIQFCDWMAMETKHVMGGESVSHGGDPSPFTSLGCFNAMKACLKHMGKPVKFNGLTVCIQGVGATGYKLAKMLVAEGATVIATDVNQAALDRAAKELGIRAMPADGDLFGTPCDILAPCALGAVLDTNVIRRLKCQIVCGTANNTLVDPDEDGAALKGRGIVYAPDFIANGGGLIRLAGLYIGLSEKQIDQKVADIETTTATVLRDGETTTSTHAAAVAYAKKRIAAGSANKPGSRERVHAH
jgi:leucine dehydrogenase